MPNFQLEVEFIDGTTGFVEMINLITGDKAGVFSVLKDKELFNQVYLAYGVATWPGEIDLALIPCTMQLNKKDAGFYNIRYIPRDCH